MNDSTYVQKQGEISLQRLLPRIEPLLADQPDGSIFIHRLKQQFPNVFRLLYSLYGDQYDFFYHLEQILLNAARFYISRPRALKALDERREAEPLWFKSENMVGGVCYVDLFAGNLEGIRAKIPYFKELGLTYLHLMPLFKAPEDESDGGYAVSDYRAVNPSLGTMQQLAELSGELRANGISLVLDFVFNHTSNEHTWAQQAIAGSEEHQNYYYMYDDRNLPDQYERNLREIFPEQSPGSFTYEHHLSKWVWTTFQRFQWDLNYSNPAVFNAMLGEMLFLANQGVEVLRLDAVAFVWKQMGTSCENLPQAHMIIQAFNGMVHMAAPAMIFKSEAIVHPDDVASYISPEESPISYNPTLMALLWEALATRDIRLLRDSMRLRFGLRSDCAWVNYVRCHDDIGWTFADEDAAKLWINGYHHRQFLNRFYTGRFDGSFAKGLPFNYNPINQDMRICGMAASLAGLEQALEHNDSTQIEYSLRRLLLIHSVILSVGGIPLLYLGDEIAALNDYSYEHQVGKQNDSRWVHRPHFPWERAAQREDRSTEAGHIFQGLLQLIDLRKHTPAFGTGRTEFFDTGSEHVLGYICDGAVLALANFSESEQRIAKEASEALQRLPQQLTDMLTQQPARFTDTLTLKPYEFVWLKLPG